MSDHPEIAKSTQCIPMECLLVMIMEGMLKNIYYCRTRRGRNERKNKEFNEDIVRNVESRNSN